MTARGLCGARKRQGEGTCTQPAGWGTPNTTGPCKLHGGSTTAHRTQARRLQAEAAARRFGIPVDTTPEAALMSELAHSVGEVVFYRARVAELPVEAMTFGVERREFAHEGAEPTGRDLTQTHLTTKPNVWITLLHQAERHLADLAATMVRIGIERRAVDMLMAQAEILHNVLEASLIRSGLSPVDQDRVRAELPRQLRLVAGHPDEAP